MTSPGAAPIRVLVVNKTSTGTSLTSHVMPRQTFLDRKSRCAWLESVFPGRGSRDAYSFSVESGFVLKDAQGQVVQAVIITE